MSYLHTLVKIIKENADKLRENEDIITEIESIEKEIIKEDNNS